MKKFFWLSLILLSVAAYGQKKGKIKGNREVITRLYTVPPFTGIETGEDLRITVKAAADTTQIQLRADENLHEVLKWDVTDGILHLRLSKKIISKKKFEVSVYVPRKFSRIMLKNYARIETDEKLRFDRLYIELHDRSAVKGSFAVKDSLGINLTDNAVLKADLEAGRVHAILKKDAYWKGDLFAKDLDLSMARSADVQLGGSIKNLSLRSTGRGELNAQKLEIKKDANIRLTDRAVARIRGNGADRLSIDLSGKAELTVIGDFSDYRIKAFKDESAIYHRSK